MVKVAYIEGLERQIEDLRREKASLRIKNHEVRERAETAEAERDRLREALANLLYDVDCLIAESEGVYGLHLNGNNAPWYELTEGGRFEEWLCTIESARATLAADQQPQGERDPLVTLISGDGTQTGFADALLAKLQYARERYGLYDEPWRGTDWHGDLCRSIAGHLAKGDPLDVASFAAFAWYHGWSLTDTVEYVAVARGSSKKRVEFAEAERDRLRAVEQAAHDLLCWTYQYAINVDPSEYSRHVKDLHPGVYNKMNAAEQTLYSALMGRKGTVTSITADQPQSEHDGAVDTEHRATVAVVRDNLTWCVIRDSRVVARGFRTEDEAHKWARQIARGELIEGDAADTDSTEGAG